MPWQQLKLQTTAEYADAINTWLSLLGAYAITLQDAADQPVLEPALDTTPIWSQTEVTALFDEKIDLNKILNFLHEQVGAQAIFDQQIEKLSEQDWERAWLNDFHAHAFWKNVMDLPKHRNTTRTQRGKYYFRSGWLLVPD